MGLIVRSLSEKYLYAEHKNLVDIDSVHHSVLISDEINEGPEFDLPRIELAIENKQIKVFMVC